MQKELEKAKRALAGVQSLPPGSFEATLTTPSPKRLDFGHEPGSGNQTPSPTPDSVTAAPSVPATTNENPTPSTSKAGLGRGCNHFLNYITQQC